MFASGAIGTDDPRPATKVASDSRLQQRSNRCIGIQKETVACLLDVLNVVPTGVAVNLGGK